MRRTVFPLLGNLSKDSVPNIRVNVSKALMAVAPYIKDNKEFMVRISLFIFSHLCLLIGLIQTDTCWLVEGN